MQETPLVSIIINNYNYGRYLNEAIRSALNQSYSKLEVIVVDDGSTDNSIEIINSYQNAIIPLLKENEGQISAFNSGFAKSKGEVVCFLDADDILMPTAIESAVPLFNHPDVVKVHWYLWEMNTSGITNGKRIPKVSLDEGYLMDKTVIEGPLCYSTSPTSGNAWARSYLQKIYPLQELGNKHGGDAYLSILAPLYGSIRKVATPQAMYRIHSDNFSGNKKKTKRDVKLYDVHCQLLEKHLLKKNIQVNSSVWINREYAWEHGFFKSVQSYFPAKTKYIIVDNGQLSEHYEMYPGVAPFMEKNGLYAGAPDDSQSAIDELERLFRNGAELIVFIQPAFWYLEYYTDFKIYLYENFKNVLSNDTFIIFDLKKEWKN